MNNNEVEDLKIQLNIANRKIETLMAEVDLYKQKYRDEVDNNEYKIKYRQLLDTHWDWKLRQQSLTELNYDGNESRGRYGEDESTY